MEASAPATAARHALPPLISSPRCFLYLPPHPSARRHGGRGDGGGLLLRPPLRMRQDPGDRTPRAPTCCCYMSGRGVAGVDSGPLVSAAALLVALQVVLLWWRCDSLEVLREDDRTIVNKAQGTTKAVQNSNCEPQTTHDNGFSEPYVSGRVTADEIDSRPWTSLDTSVYISRPKEVSVSTSTAKPSYSEEVTGVPGMPQSVLGQDKSKYLSTTLGRVTGLPHQLLSLSGRKEVIKSCQGHIDKPVDSEGSNLSERHQSNQEEHLDLTYLSSFQRVAKNHSNFVPHARNNSLLEPRKSIKFRNSYANFSYLPAGNLCPVACLKEGPLSEQKKAMKGDENATVNCLNISKVLKENPDNLTPAKKGEVKGMKDTLDYLRIYNSFLIDGRLEDCLDLLESMEQKGFLDIKRINHASFFSMCKKRRAVSQALRFCRLIDRPKMSTFNMLLSVCAHSQDFDGALQVMVLLKDAGLTPDCKLYTTLISTCAKCRKVDAMFEVFHEMVSAGIEPNVNTYSALIDGCARAGQVAKAFGAYGIMSSKKVKPDRVVFNALISACGESGAVARAFDVLSEMIAESSESKGTGPIFPDHVTVGALMKTCIQAGQAHRAREVYKMLHDYDIKGTPEVYTIALRSCSLTGDLGFALKIYEDMNKIGVKPDEMFLSALVDVAGHARRADAAFEIMKDARAKDLQVGTMAYSSLMGACCNAKDWKKALQLYKEIKSIKLVPTVSTMNALITSLCDGDQVLKAIDVLKEMNRFGLHPNEITYSVLFVACERNSEAQRGLDLFERSKLDGIGLNPTIIGCLTGLCLQMFENDLSLGNIIVKFNLGKPQIDNKWTSAAIRVYREAISVGLLPSSDVLSQVLGCLRLPHDSSLKNTFIENTGISCDIPQHTNVNSLFEGFGEYDIRAFSILEEAASLGAVESITMKDSRIVIDARKSRIYTAEVSLLTTLRSLKHRLAAGARLPNVTILLSTEKKQVDLDERERTLKLAGRIGQAVGSLLRRLGISYQGDESHGRMRVNGLTLRRWFNPKLQRISSAAAPAELLPLPLRLAKGIADQQRKIRNLSLE